MVGHAWLSSALQPAQLNVVVTILFIFTRRIKSLNGFSDDRLLNVTSAIGGFLQNASGYGTIPTFSGYNPTDEFGISAESISDQVV